MARSSCFSNDTPSLARQWQLRSCYVGVGWLATASKEIPSSRAVSKWKLTLFIYATSRILLFYYCSYASACIVSFPSLASHPVPGPRHLFRSQEATEELLGDSCAIPPPAPLSQGGMLTFISFLFFLAPPSSQSACIDFSHPFGCQSAKVALLSIGSRHSAIARYTHRSSRRRQAPVLWPTNATVNPLRARIRQITCCLTRTIGRSRDPKLRRRYQRLGAHLAPRYKGLPKMSWTQRRSRSVVGEYRAQLPMSHSVLRNLLASQTAIDIPSVSGRLRCIPQVRMPVSWQTTRSLPIREVTSWTLRLWSPRLRGTECPAPWCIV